MVDDILASEAPLRAFLTAVHAHTEAAGASQTSMYAVGEALGMARQEAQRAAEHLIGLGLVEVRTLSGGIGLSDEGVAACLQIVGPEAGGHDAAACLGTGAILSEADRSLTDDMLTRLKYLAGDKSWAFEALTDLLADLRTIDAQLMSSRPKTAIITECFRSVQAILAGAGYKDVAQEVGCLLGE